MLKLALIIIGILCLNGCLTPEGELDLSSLAELYGSSYYQTSYEETTANLNLDERTYETLTNLSLGDEPDSEKSNPATLAHSPESNTLILLGIGLVALTIGKGIKKKIFTLFAINCKQREK
ncbi:MAG: hypothetical protein NC828_00695 [Candidatus Omnitrophica bacterium]|nr:hypothetical protein [Candidatus Omnitrophota bacterium]